MQPEDYGIWIIAILGTIFFYYRAYKKRKSVDKVWQSLAQQLNYKFYPRENSDKFPRIEGTHKNRFFAIEGFTVPAVMGGGRGTVSYTRITYPDITKSTPKTEIHRKYVVNKFITSDLTDSFAYSLNDMEFEKNYIVKVRESKNISQIIDQNIREKLIKLKREFFVNGGIIKIGENKIVYEHLSIITDKSYILSVIDLLSEIADNCEKITT